MNKITFKYITLELIEKIFRLKSYITKNGSKKDNNSNNAVIMIFEKAILNLLSNIEKTISDINEIDNETTINEIFSIQRNLSQYYLTIKELHGELHFLSTDWLKLETYTFIEQLYEKHFNPKPKKEKLNIILSDDYTFIETNLDKRFERIMNSFFEQSSIYLSEESPTVIIPKMEYSNPLNWTILVHELGHVDKENIKELCSKEAMFPDNISISEKEKLINWAEEIYCDIVAIRIIGPAYFTSLASFAMLETLVIGLGVSSNSHPPFAMRLALLFSYLDKNELKIQTIMPDGKNDTIHSFIYKMTENINSNLKNVNNTIGAEPSISDLMLFYKFIRNELIKDDKYLKNIDPIFNLVDDLNKMIPIGSYRSHSKDEEYLEKLKLKELTIDEFNLIKDSLTERNAELWEIINTGWVYKIQTIIPFGLKLFFESNEFSIEEKLKSYSEKLEMLDDRLLVSIETSKLIDLIEN
jgi:hypothetical protein